MTASTARARLPRLLVLALVTTSIAPTAAQAMSAGDHCTLRGQLPVRFPTKNGTADNVLEAGSEVLVRIVAGRTARVMSDGSEWIASVEDLAVACHEKLEVCRVTAPIVMRESTHAGEGREWRIKPDAQVTVTKKGKTWAAVKVDDLAGYVKSDELALACNTPGTAGARAFDDADPVERGEGPGVLVLPFTVAPGSSASLADECFDTLVQATEHYRPDSSRAPREAAPRKRGLSWKETVTRASADAHELGFSYALAGRLEQEGDDVALTLAVVDPNTHAMLKGVKAHPQGDENPLWARAALSSLLQAIPLMAGSSIPEAPKTAPEASRPDDGRAPSGTLPGGTTGALDPTSTNAGTSLSAGWEQRPWYSNGVAYGVLGVGAALAAGGAATGAWALVDTSSAAQRSELDASRAAERQSARTKSYVADGLYASALIFTVTSVVLFSTGVGMSEP